jgi:hypothetical protein
MESKLLQRERHDELQPGVLPKQEAEVVHAKLAKWRVAETTKAFANWRIALAVGPERVQLCERLVSDTGREHAI